MDESEKWASFDTGDMGNTKLHLVVRKQEDLEVNLMLSSDRNLEAFQCTLWFVLDDIQNANNNEIRRLEIRHGLEDFYFKVGLNEIQHCITRDNTVYLSIYYLRTQ